MMRGYSSKQAVGRRKEHRHHLCREEQTYVQRWEEIWVAILGTLPQGMVAGTPNYPHANEHLLRVRLWFACWKATGFLLG